MTTTEKNSIAATLGRIAEIAPGIHAILVSDASLEEKRRRLLVFISRHLDELMEKRPDMRHLEWILAQKCANVLQNLLSSRNERLAGFGFLAYLVDALTRPGVVPAPSPGFLEEVTRLLKGLMTVTGVYPNFMAFCHFRANFRRFQT